MFLNIVYSDHTKPVSRSNSRREDQRKCPTQLRCGMHDPTLQSEAVVYSQRRCTVPSPQSLHEYLTRNRKDEFPVIIIASIARARESRLYILGLPLDIIVPTVGQNAGKIALPSAVLRFWDLGGQCGTRSISPKY
ncbi:hypothetical protein BGY98DRAFT_1114625 [Russula aff. rugulosa BPL654]|nr:hypothetical protein BGY98DRAFT_1114625 [Russula aff. rugulosa BPL654]